MAKTIATDLSGSSILTNLNTLNNVDKHIFRLEDNYIYLYHLDTFIILPNYADSVQDTLSVSFSPSTPLTGSAPIQSFQNAGPRTVQVNFKLHRDMMTQINYNVSNAPVGSSQGTVTSPESKPSDDYVDFMIKALQTMALPSYGAAEKMVNPPIVALRLGNDIFIKGVIQGAVGLTYNFPILRNGKYSSVDVSFTIVEVGPYDAETVLQTGSFRGLDTTLERRLAQVSDTTPTQDYVTPPTGVIFK